MLSETTKPPASRRAPCLFSAYPLPLNQRLSNHHDFLAVQIFLMDMYNTLRHYGIVWCIVVRYNTIRYLYGTVRQGDIWITKDNVITKLIRSFELSKNCGKNRVPSIMMRTSDLCNTGWEPCNMTTKRVAKKPTAKEMRGVEKRAFEPARIEDVYCYR